MPIKTIPLSATLLTNRRILPAYTVGIDIDQAIALTGYDHLPPEKGIPRAMIVQVVGRYRLLAVCVGSEWVVLSETIPHADWATVFGPDWAPEPATSS